MNNKEMNLITPGKPAAWRIGTLLIGDRQTVEYKRRTITAEDMGSMFEDMGRGVFAAAYRDAAEIGDELMDTPGFVDGVNIITDSPDDYPALYVESLGRMVVEYVECCGKGGDVAAILLNEYPYGIEYYPAARAAFFLNGVDGPRLLDELKKCGWQYRVHKVLHFSGMFPGDLVLLTNVEEMAEND